MTLKQRIGKWLYAYAPVTPHVLNHIRLETDAYLTRIRNHLSPRDIKIRRTLRGQKGLRVNVGCGPFGLPGWVNLDLCRHPQVTLRTDCRRSLPLVDGSCDGIHVEHFLEHLEPFDERPKFLKSCLRSLRPGGVLRIIVPDAERYLRAYLEPGWQSLNQMGCGGDSPQYAFPTKMEAINHVFLQGWEHYGGLDQETLEYHLRQAGFHEISKKDWRVGEFPGGCIDREQHRPYSLFMEAKP